MPAGMDVSVPFIEDLRLKSIDVRFKIRGGRETSGNVIIAGIEQRGIDAYGRWPWPRSVFAKLLVRLKESGAKTVVFDLLFPEPEKSRVAEAVGSLADTYMELELLNDNFQNQIFFDEMVQVVEESDNDSLMGEAVAWADNVILGVVFEPGEKAELPDIDIDKALYQYDPGNKMWNQRDFFSRDRILLPISKLGRDTAAMGYTNVFPENDGIIRREKPVIMNEDVPFMPLAVAAAGHYLNKKPFLDPGGSITIGGREIEFDDSGSIYLDFYGPENTFAGYSIADIIEGRIPPDQLKDKAVIIGGMATGLGDIWPTPFIGEIPGVFIQATFLDNILQNRVMKIPANQVWICFAAILALVFLPLALRIVVSPLLSTFAGVITMTGYASLTQYVFNTHQLIWPIVLPLGAGVSAALILLVYNFITEQKQKSFIKNAFGQYLSPEVIDILVKNPDKLSLGGERREMTAYFSDVAGFSSISEQLDPDQLVALLNEYLTEMTDIIAKYNGTVDKFEGDAIIAFWGAPLDQPDHALLCCLATIEMQNRMKEIRDRFAREDKPVLNVRMGINTGPMVVGNMGSQTRMDYTMMGDAVNLAARLEGANKYYSTYTMISHYTYDKVKDEVEVRELDTIRVVGKKEPITVYELLETRGNLDRMTSSLVSRYNSALELYKNQKFDESKAEFESIVQDYPEDGPSQTYISRCELYNEEPPGDEWDGVFNLTAK